MKVTVTVKQAYAFTADAVGKYRFSKQKFICEAKFCKLNKFDSIFACNYEGTE